MSLLRAIKAQLGLSGTPGNNFTLDASADNGTMKLARNSGQDIMTVDAAGKVAFPQMVQTWQDMIASRALNTDYTNGTGQTIQVNASAISSTSSSMNATVNGMVLRGSINGGAAGRCSITFNVPPGGVYSVTALATTSSVTWMELR